MAATVANYALKNGIPVRVWGSHLNGANVSTVGSSSAQMGNTLSWPELLESLAVASAVGPSTVVEGMASLPTGANLFVVVSAYDDLRRENLRRALARSGEAVVVVLEGFGESPGEGDIPIYLGHQGYSVITCRPGGLAETISEIESLGQWNHAGVSTMSGGGPSNRGPYAGVESP